MWTDSEIDFLKNNYPDKGKMWCCNALSKSESAVRTKSAELKLRLNHKSDFFKEFQIRAAQSKVGKKRPEHSIQMKKLASEGRLPAITEYKTDAEREIMSKNTKKWIAEKGHPKGYLGKNHSIEVRERISALGKKAWADPKSKFNTEKYRQDISDRMTKLRNETPKSNPYSRTKSGNISIGDKKIFVRSSWEANIASYLEFLKEQKEIIEWEYEPETFWFEKIKRGVRSYKPDFKITNKDASTYFIEVKGWMDDKSKTKLKRMRIYYPKIKIEILDQKRYKEISKSKSLFKYWGLLDTK